MENRNLTIGDIAQKLGVSKTTVSRAISGKGRIGEATRQKVLACIEEYHYRPNVMAKGLAQNKTYNLGLVLPGDSNAAELPFFQDCMLGISRAASEKDYDVLILMVTAEDISQLKRAVTNRKIDGVILTRTLEEDAAIGFLKQSGIPFIAIGDTKEETVARIDNDHRSACRELTDRLLQSGIQKIGLIGGSENHMVTKDRLNGFRDALLLHGKEHPQEKIFLNADSRAEVDMIVKELVADKAQCIVAMDDFLCSCVLDCLRRMEIAVPAQIRVASFYDSTFLASQSPRVPSIYFDVEKLGGKACEMILKQMEGAPAENILLSEYELRIVKNI